MLLPLFKAARQVQICTTYVHASIDDHVVVEIVVLGMRSKGDQD